MAPPLLGRFQNGLLYRFIRGKPCDHLDLVSPPIWRGVARHLAKWHATLPCNGLAPSQDAAVAETEKDTDITLIQPRHAGPSIWAVIQKWVLALPVATPEQRARRLSLQEELQWVVELLDDGKGIGKDGVCLWLQSTELVILWLILESTARFLTRRSPLCECYCPPE